MTPISSPVKSSRAGYTSSDGRRSARVRLTPEQVVFARMAAKEGAGLRALSDQLNVDGTTLHQAISGYTWSHLDYIEPPTMMTRRNLSVDQAVCGTGIIDVDLLPKHGSTRLEGRQVIDARRLIKHRPNLSMGGVAAALNLDVCSATLGQAIRGETWTHLNDVEAPVSATARERKRLHKKQVCFQNEERRNAKRLGAMRNRLAKLLLRNCSKATGISAIKAVEILRAKRASHFDAYAEAFRLKISTSDVYAVARGDIWPELQPLLEVL